MLNHPEVQENIRIELTEITSEDCPPQLSKKSRFPYCEAVMAESQRLGNILPMSLPHTAFEVVFCKRMNVHNVIQERFKGPVGSMS
jgi:cytochrome P450 family 2 subfamily K